LIRQGHLIETFVKDAKFKPVPVLQVTAAAPPPAQGEVE
jgi:hypothetical protein